MEWSGKFGDNLVSDALIDAVKEVTSGVQIDSSGAPLTVGDSIRVQEGPHAGSTGTISSFENTGTSEIQLDQGPHVSLYNSVLLNEELSAADADAMRALIKNRQRIADTKKKPAPTATPSEPSYDGAHGPEPSEHPYGRPEPAPAKVKPIPRKKVSAASQARGRARLAAIGDAHAKTPAGIEAAKRKADHAAQNQEYTPDHGEMIDELGDTPRGRAALDAVATRADAKLTKLRKASSGPRSSMPSRGPGMIGIRDTRGDDAAHQSTDRAIDRRKKKHQKTLDRAADIMHGDDPYKGKKSPTSDEYTPDHGEMINNEFVEAANQYFKMTLGERNQKKTEFDDPNPKKLEKKFRENDGQVAKYDKKKKLGNGEEICINPEVVEAVVRHLGDNTRIVNMLKDAAWRERGIGLSEGQEKEITRYLEKKGFDDYDFWFKNGLQVTDQSTGKQVIKALKKWNSRVYGKAKIGKASKDAKHGPSLAVLWNEGVEDEDPKGVGSSRATQNYKDATPGQGSDSALPPEALDYEKYGGHDPLVPEDEVADILGKGTYFK